MTKAVQLEAQSGKVVRETATVSEQLELLSAVKASGLSLPAIIAMSIVNENNSAKYPMVYPGEVQAIYHSIIRAPGVKPRSKKDVAGLDRPWTYSAVCRMLRVLAAKGYLNSERDGRYIAYGMTTKGIKFLKNTFGDTVLAAHLSTGSVH